VDPGLDDGVIITGCRSGNKSVLEDVEKFGRSRGRFGDQSVWSLGKDALVRDSGVVDGSGVRKLEDNGDGFCGDGIDLPDTERGPDVNPDGGEELKGMYRIGDFRDEKEDGIPLCMCSDSGSSRGKDSGIGTGAVERVNPDDPGGLDKVRADGRVPPGILAALEKEELCRLPGRVFEVEGLQDREAFQLLILANVTEAAEYITYMNALDVCSERLLELLTLKDGI
jgi:hypothetical protein